MNLRPDKLRTPRVSQICRRATHTWTTGCVMTDHVEECGGCYGQCQQDYMFTTPQGTFWACTMRPLVLQCDLPLLLASLFIWPPHCGFHWVTVSDCELCDETSKCTVQTAIWYWYQQQDYFNNKILIKKRLFCPSVSRTCWGKRNWQ